MGQNQDMVDTSSEKAPDSRLIERAAVNFDTTTKANLETLGLPPDAVEWLCGLWAVAQVFDDAADGDPVNRAQLDAALWFCLVGQPTNGFFQRNHAVLLGVVATAILEWQASDYAERAKQADARSFGWRAGFYRVVLAACQICHAGVMTGKEAALVLGMHGESFADYVKEFSNA